MDKKALKFFCNHGKIDCPECQPIPAPSSPEVKEALPLEWLKLLPKDDRDYLLKPGPLSDYPGLNGILGRLAAEVRRLTGEVERLREVLSDETEDNSINIRERKKAEAALLARQTLSEEDYKKDAADLYHMTFGWDDIAIPQIVAYLKSRDERVARPSVTEGESYFMDKAREIIELVEKNGTGTFGTRAVAAALSRPIDAGGKL